MQSCRAISEAAPTVDASGRCKALASTDFSQIPDALAQVMDAKSMDPSTSAGGAACCEVSGYVVPSIGSLVRLLFDGWNGKFVELGCGGTCGSLSQIAGWDDPLRRGYA
jgi:hypothetical protein